jgi:hypothetical protein
MPENFQKLVDQLLEAFKSSGPQIQNALTASHLQSLLGCDPAMLGMATDRLERERKIRSVADQGAWIITELGFADAKPSTPAQINLLFADKIENSQIMQGSPSSVQNFDASPQEGRPKAAKDRVVTSSISNLQNAATDSSVPVTDLLRKALLVATDLNAPDFIQWLRSELEGYGECEDSEIPKYREVVGTIHTRSANRGWAPLMASTLEVTEVLKPLTIRRIAQPASELEAMLRSSSEKSRLRMEFPDEIQNLISQGIGRQRHSCLVIPTSRLPGILDGIRTSVLNWTLKLKTAGVTGSEVGFTDDEIKKGRRLQINILNIYGNATGAMIQQGSHRATQSKAPPAP